MEMLCLHLGLNKQFGVQAIYEQEIEISRIKFIFPLTVQNVFIKFHSSMGYLILRLICNTILIDRGRVKKKFPNVLPNNAKMINPRVKFQAWCQIHFSRALK